MQNDAIGGLSGIIGALALILSVTVHEFCHGLAAYVQGDRTAERLGRLTLNPIAHIDPFGSVILPLLLLVTGSPFMIGWAKPVPFNPYNLRNQRYGPLIVGVAGPLANFCLFLIGGVLLKFLHPVLLSDNLLTVFLVQMTVINFVLMLFNLIPIPPLDGSKVLFGLLPPRYDFWMQRLEQYGPYILLGILFIEYTGYPFINATIAISFAFMTRLLGIPL